MRVDLFEQGASDIVRLRTDGGSSFIFRLRYLDFPKDSLPSPGQEAGEDFLAAAESASQAYGAEVKALDLLARAEHTRYLLALKLRKRKMPDAAIAASLDYLESKGFLDDERYARAWAEERIRKRGEGPTRLTAGLVARGVRDELAKRVTNELLPQDSRQEVLCLSLRRMTRTGRLSDERVIARLRTAGWKPSEIAAAISALRNGGD